MFVMKQEVIRIPVPDWLFVGQCVYSSYIQEIRVYLNVIPCTNISLVHLIDL